MNRLRKILPLLFIITFLSCNKNDEVIKPALYTRAIGNYELILLEYNGQTAVFPQQGASGLAKVTRVTDSSVKINVTINGNGQTQTIPVNEVLLEEFDESMLESRGSNSTSSYYIRFQSSKKLYIVSNQPGQNMTMTFNKL